MVVYDGGNNFISETTTDIETLVQEGTALLQDINQGGGMLVDSQERVKRNRADMSHQSNNDHRPFERMAWRSPSTGATAPFSSSLAAAAASAASEEVNEEAFDEFGDFFDA